MVCLRFEYRNSGLVDHRNKLNRLKSSAPSRLWLGGPSDDSYPIVPKRDHLYELIYSVEVGFERLDQFKGGRSDFININV